MVLERGILSVPPLKHWGTSSNTTRSVSNDLLINDSILISLSEWSSFIVSVHTHRSKIEERCRTKRTRLLLLYRPPIVGYGLAKRSRDVGAIKVVPNIRMRQHSRTQRTRFGITLKRTKFDTNSIRLFLSVFGILKSKKNLFPKVEVQKAPQQKDDK